MVGSVDARVGSTHGTSLQHMLPPAWEGAGMSLMHLSSLLQLVSSTRAVKCA